MVKLPEMIAGDPAKRFVSYCLATGPKSRYNHAFDAAHLWESVYTNMQMIDYVWGVIFRDIDITKDLEKLNKPVLLALGKYDFLTGPPELWDNVKKHFKNITIKIFEKSSHCPMYEEAALFDNELINWSNKTEKSLY